MNVATLRRWKNVLLRLTHQYSKDKEHTKYRDYIITQNLPIYTTQRKLGHTCWTPIIIIRYCTTNLSFFITMNSTAHVSISRKMIFSLFQLLWLALAISAEPSGRFAVLRRWNNSVDDCPITSRRRSIRDCSNANTKESIDNYNYNIDIKTDDGIQESSHCEGRYAMEYGNERKITRSAEHAHVLQRRHEYANDNSASPIKPASSNTNDTEYKSRQRRAFIQNNDPVFV